MKRVLIVAGEASGDRLGAGLARVLREREPDILLEGMGGAAMRGAGVEILVDSTALGVTGLVEVLRHWGDFRKAMDTLVERLDTHPPDVVVPIDYPDFNLRLARKAGARELPVVYFVSPQIWAWRRGRVRQIAHSVRRMLVLFPFEADFYRRAGVSVSFVGHPMVERLDGVPDKAECRRVLGLPPGEPIMGLLPGSRVNEVERILPAMAGAASILHGRIPRIHFVLPTSERVPEAVYGRALEDAPPILRFEDRYEELVRACDAAAVASGTATMETALLGTPMVAVYRVHPLTYWLARLLVRVDHIAMPNLLLDRRAVAELVQGDLRAETLAGEVEALLVDTDRRAAQVGALDEVRGKMAGQRPFPAAAEAVLAEASS